MDEEAIPKSITLLENESLEMINLVGDVTLLKGPCVAVIVKTKLQCFQKFTRYTSKYITVQHGNGSIVHIREQAFSKLSNSPQDIHNVVLREGEIAHNIRCTYNGSLRVELYGHVTFMKLVNGSLVSYAGIRCGPWSFGFPKAFITTNEMSNSTSSHPNPSEYLSDPFAATPTKCCSESLLPPSSENSLHFDQSTGGHTSEPIDWQTPPARFSSEQYTHNALLAPLRPITALSLCKATTARARSLYDEEWTHTSRRRRRREHLPVSDGYDSGYESFSDHTGMTSGDSQPSSPTSISAPSSDFGDYSLPRFLSDIQLTPRKIPTPSTPTTTSNETRKRTSSYLSSDLQDLEDGDIGLQCDETEHVLKKCSIYESIWD